MKKNSARKKALSVDPNLPSDYPAMQRLPDAKEWLEAAQLELDGVRQCMTPLDFAWIRKHHPDTKILPSVLVSKIKRNTDGSIRVRKVRLCVGATIRAHEVARPSDDFGVQPPRGLRTDH